MLMTVLRGELATRQSRAIVIALKALKDYVNETQGLLTQRDLLRLSIQTAENTNAIKSMSLKMADQQKILSLLLLIFHVRFYHCQTSGMQVK